MIKTLKNITIAAAQTIPATGEVGKNIEAHMKLALKAAEYNASLVVFPELSLTGYELSIASELAFTIFDGRLKPIVSLAEEFNLIVVAGAPFRLEENLFIGAFIISPDNSVSIYAKHHVHSSEEKVFQSGYFNPGIHLGQEKASLAVCADLAHPIHAERASQSGSTMYLASVFITPEGYPKDARMLQKYARIHKMVVLMSNYGGESGGLSSAGKSTIWSDEGKKVASMAGMGEGLVIAKKENGVWKGESILMN
jgi:predicted amidohydrolase